MKLSFFPSVAQRTDAAGARAPLGRILPLVTLASTLSFAVGCRDSGPPRAAVQGNVSWNGAPVDAGTISFIPDAGPAATAEIVAGKYALAKEEGAIFATHTVQIFGIKNLGSVEAGPPHPPGTMIDATEQYIPAKFNNATTLTVEIKDGDNQHDFDLKK